LLGSPYVREHVLLQLGAALEQCDALG